MKKNIVGYGKLIILLVIVIGFLFSGIVSAETYKIGKVAWAGWSAMDVADAKGFFKDEGVDVRIVTTNDSMQLTRLLQGKVIHIGFHMIGSVVGLRMEGSPVVILGETDWSHGGDKIIVKKDIDASSLGKKPIGVYLNQPSVLFFLGKYCSTIGLKLSDVRIIEKSSELLTDYFIQDRFNVIVNYDPNAMRAEREGNGKNVATSATYEGCIPEGMIAMEDVVKTIPKEDLVKIFRGWIRAALWVKNPDNWKEFMKILNERTFKGNPPYSEKDLKEMIDAVRIHDPSELLERNRAGGGMMNYLTELKAFLKSNGMLKTDIDLQNMVKNQALLEALGTGE